MPATILATSPARTSPKAAGRLVTFVPAAPTGKPDFDAMGVVLLDVAKDVVAADKAIKLAALAAADAGDAPRAAVILRRWLTEPSTDLAKALRGGAQRCG